MSRRRQGDDLSGILNLAKPANMSSATAVARVKRCLNARRVGHAGTLDPRATGVLPICLGSATRLVEFAHRWSKVYRATVRLGIVSETYDAEGPLTPGSDPSQVDEAALLQVLPQFTGQIVQRPPIYSALHQGGERMYNLARRGDAVEAPPREVEVHRLELLGFSGGPEAEAVLEIECATGTYVRSLAHDIGATLGCGAHLANLVRVAYGPLQLSEAIELETFEAQSTELARASLLPPDRFVTDLPAVALGLEQHSRLLNGNPVAVEDRLMPGAAVRAYWQGRLVAIARVSPMRTLEPVKVFPELAS